jgi:hypothetical protein
MKLISKTEGINKVKFADLTPGEKFTPVDDNKIVYTKVVPDKWQFGRDELKEVKNVGLAVRDDGTLCVWSNSPADKDIVELVKPRSAFKALIEISSEEEYEKLLNKFIVERKD